MKDLQRLLWLGTGALLGALAVGFYLGQARPVEAANDRFQDYVMCTGTFRSQLLIGGRGRINSPLDGVWLLDYRSGKLRATVIEKNTGKVLTWAELDLVKEFGIPPRQNVHFLMTTGSVDFNHAALYIAETTTSKFGVYSMIPRDDGEPGIQIHRHDLASFRPEKS